MTDRELEQIVGGSKETLIFDGICISPGYNVLPRGTTPILLGWKEEKK